MYFIKFITTVDLMSKHVVMLQILAVKAQQDGENPLCEEHFGHSCSPGARPCCAHTGRQCVATSSNGFHCQ